MNSERTVFVVDDDPSVGKAVSRLLRAHGYTTQVFASAQEFMNHYQPGSRGCLLVDFSMPEITGLELQQSLQALGVPLSIVFLTGLEEIPEEERTMMLNGAVGILAKPVNTSALLSCVEEALARSCEAQERESANRGCAVSPENVST